MEAVDPVECVTVEKIRDLVPAEIVDRGVPVRLKTLARVGVFVERCAVKPRQSLFIGREMGRHPVKDDAQARGVRSIDEAREGGRIAETAGRGK